MSIHNQQAVKISITRSLGVHGWDHLDPVLLAALATQSPLLLVGPHGTAKSLLIERVANVLDLSMRHYNASLLNYDDLVGIPVPEEGNESLRFITTPGSIWDAEFVFFDEISRCRPDLQNKMFPIIHERRIAGIQLEQLQHRWAAMNPPAPDDLTGTVNQSVTYYLGSEALDPALTDRFPFIVHVPNWKELSKEDRRQLVAIRPGSWSATGESLSAIALGAMIEACVDLIPQVEDELQAWLPDYLLLVMDLLEKAQLPQSPRRANMLARSIAAVHAALRVLEGEDADLQDSAEIALQYGLPQNATEVPPSEATMVAIHKQAWEIASLMGNDLWRQVLEEPDAVRRVKIADDLGLETADISRLITQALGAQSLDSRRLGLGVALFLAFRERYDLAPAAWEPLAQYAAKVLEPRVMSAAFAPGNDANIWKQINDWINEQGNQDTVTAKLKQNYVLCGFPELWRRENWREAVDRFGDDLTLFGIQ
jgi:MoxR-like ATPase